ncbi:MAG: glycosyltransferase family 39 protein [bacterium]
MINPAHILATGNNLNNIIMIFFIILTFAALASIINNQKKDAFIILLVILLFGVLFHVFFGYFWIGQHSSFAWGSDDAYISYRYASNLAQGHGLVYNVGERVEGYTNFLFVLIMSLGEKLFGDAGAYPFACVFNFLIIIMLFVVFYKYLKEKYGETNALLGGLMFVLCPPLWLWAASGTEAVLVLFIQTIIYIFLQKAILGGRKKDLFILCGLMVLSVLVRADGFILPLVVIAYLLIKKEWRLSYYCFVSAFLPLAIYVTWRWSYYGYLFPNTYYAKVSGPILLRVNYALNNLPRDIWIYLSIFGAGLIWRLKDKLSGRVDKLAGISFIYFYVSTSLLYWLYIGGDFYQERFLIVFFPLGIIILIDYLSKIRRSGIIEIMVLLVAIIQLMPLYSPLIDQRFAYQYPKYDNWITLGKFIKTKYQGKVIAGGAGGKIPYFSGLKAIDSLGLNDKYIAHKDVGSIKKFTPGHNKFDPDYVFSRKPDLIIDWIDRDSLDLVWGINRRDYLNNGYEIRYLLNTNKISLEENIIDVKHFSLERIEQLIKRGFRFGVLERND